MNEIRRQRRPRCLNCIKPRPQIASPRLITNCESKKGAPFFFPGVQSRDLHIMDKKEGVFPLLPSTNFAFRVDRKKSVFFLQEKMGLQNPKSRYCSLEEVGVNSMVGELYSCLHIGAK